MGLKQALIVPSTCSFSDIVKNIEDTRSQSIQWGYFYRSTINWITPRNQGSTVTYWLFAINIYNIYIYMYVCKYQCTSIDSIVCIYTSTSAFGPSTSNTAVASRENPAGMHHDRLVYPALDLGYDDGPRTLHIFLRQVLNITHYHSYSSNCI